MFVQIFSPGVGAFLTLLINLSFPTLGNLIKKFQNLSNPHPLPALPPHGVYINRCITCLWYCLSVFVFVYFTYLVTWRACLLVCLGLFECLGLLARHSCNPRHTSEPSTSSTPSNSSRPRHSSNTISKYTIREIYLVSL